VSGPWEAFEDFRRAAAGAGEAGWRIDYERLEEGLVTLLLDQPPPRISAAGARWLAREVRDLVWRDHEEALARIGVDRGCPFDLNALVPVPWPVLRLGEDDPRALAWLWENWGTTWPLRRVEARPLPRAALAALPAEHVGCEIRFWSADWSPWPVLLDCRRRWPALRFDLRVEYWDGIGARDARRPAAGSGGTVAAPAEVREDAARRAEEAEPAAPPPRPSRPFSVGSARRC
jgi:hypothetical protein